MKTQKQYKKCIMNQKRKKCVVQLYLNQNNIIFFSLSEQFARLILFQIGGIFYFSLRWYILLICKEGIEFVALIDLYPSTLMLAFRKKEDLGKYSGINKLLFYFHRSMQSQNERGWGSLWRLPGPNPSFHSRENSNRWLNCVHSVLNT